MMAWPSGSLEVDREEQAKAGLQGDFFPPFLSGVFGVNRLLFSRHKCRELVCLLSLLLLHEGRGWAAGVGDFLGVTI